MANTLYVPTYNNNNCVVLQNNTTIRVYATRPQNNTTVNYIDYYFTSGYYSNIGSTQFTQYSTLPTCRTDITTNWLYRYDSWQIFLIAFIIFSWLILFVYSPIKKIMGRWLRYD